MSISLVSSVWCGGCTYMFSATRGVAAGIWLFGPKYVDGRLNFITIIEY